MSKHSPALWTYDERGQLVDRKGFVVGDIDNDANRVVTEPPTAESTAGDPPGTLYHQLDDEDGVLAAAAPDMLKALKAASKWIRRMIRWSSMWQSERDLVTQIDAAIERARCSE